MTLALRELLQMPVLGQVSEARVTYREEDEYYPFMGYAIGDSLYEDAATILYGYGRIVDSTRVLPRDFHPAFIVARGR